MLSITSANDAKTLGGLTTRLHFIAHLVSAVGRFSKIVFIRNHGCYAALFINIDVAGLSTGRRFDDHSIHVDQIYIFLSSPTLCKNEIHIILS
jgi:hypothetical protein